MLHHSSLTAIVDEDPGATHGGEEPKKRFWQRRPAWMQKKDPCGLEEWNPRALQNERSVLDAPNSVFDIKKTWAEMLPYVIDSA